MLTWYYLSLALLRAFLLAGEWILLWVTRLVQVRSLMRLADSSWMSALGPGGTLWLLAPMLWLRRLPVESRIGGSRLIFRSLLSFVFLSRLRWYVVLGSLSLFGLLAGLIRLIGPHPLPLRLFRIFGTSAGRSLGVFLLVLSWLVGPLLMEMGEMSFGTSAGAEAGLLRAYHRAGGPVASGFQAFVGRGTLRIRRRRLGSGAVGSGAASKLYLVSQGDEVGVASAEYFVNSFPQAG